jgi:hypothetical protein
VKSGARRSSQGNNFCDETSHNGTESHTFSTVSRRISVWLHISTTMRLPLHPTALTFTLKAVGRAKRVTTPPSPDLTPRLRDTPRNFYLPPKPLQANTPRALPPDTHLQTLLSRGCRVVTPRVSCITIILREAHDIDLGGAASTRNTTRIITPQ